MFETYNFKHSNQVSGDRGSSTTLQADCWKIWKVRLVCNLLVLFLQDMAKWSCTKTLYPKNIGNTVFNKNDWWILIFLCVFCFPVEQLVKCTKNSCRLVVKVEGRKKETYYFTNMRQREHFCQVMQQLKNMHSVSEDIQQISVFVGTWNLGEWANYRVWWYGKGSSGERTIITKKLVFNVLEGSSYEALEQRRVLSCKEVVHKKKGINIW